MYMEKYAKRIKLNQELSDDLHFSLQEQEENVDILPSGEGLKVPREQRVTTPYMTKYERARVLGTRALQIA
jgi:DNA-directed RNA polymerase I, II, and III subunit RPABC2